MGETVAGASAGPWMQLCFALYRAKIARPHIVWVQQLDQHVNRSEQAVRGRRRADTLATHSRSRCLCRSRNLLAAACARWIALGICCEPVKHPGVACEVQTNGEGTRSRTESARTQAQAPVPLLTRACTPTSPALCNVLTELLPETACASSTQARARARVRRIISLAMLG